MCKLMVLNQKQRKSVILILLLLLNISIRLPTTTHPVFHDSYVNLWKTEKIIRFSYAVDEWARPWRIDVTKIKAFLSAPFDVFASTEALKNAYPLPPPIIHQLSAAFYSLVTGMNPEYAALVYSILSGILGLLGAVLLAEELTKDRVVKYLTAFFYSTAPAFTSITSWSMLSRSLLAGILPFLLLFLLRYHRLKNSKYLLLSILVGVSFLLVHRIGFVFFVVLLSYVFSSSFTEYAKKRKKRLKHVLRILPYLCMLLVVSLSLLPFYLKTGLFRQALWKYRWGYLAAEVENKRVFFNLLADYYSSLGLMSVLALVGFVEVSFRLRYLKFSDFFLVSSLIFLAPFTVFGEYLTLLVLPVSSFLISGGMKKTLNVLGRIGLVEYDTLLLPALTSGLLLSSVCFSFFMMNHWYMTTKIPFLDMNQWTDGRIIRMEEYVNGLPGRIAAPQYFTPLSTYMAPYLIEDDKIYYVSDFREDLVERNITHIIESWIIKKLWKPLFGGSSESTFMERVHETRDCVFSSGLVDVWVAYEAYGGFTALNSSINKTYDGEDI